MPTNLPPGQRKRATFPRFGLLQFANRFPKETQNFTLRVGGSVAEPLTLVDPLRGLERVEQTSDFHCVTTWTHVGLRWSGVRFVDVYNAIIAPGARPNPSATLVALRGQDGARTAMLLEDLLAPDVLLADTLNGTPLMVEHGAPVRLVAPGHYGYKSIKYLSQIEFRDPADGYKTSGPGFMDHLRARVDREERGRYVPGWLLRWVYRPMIGSTVKRFATASPSKTRP